MRSEVKLEINPDFESGQDDPLLLGSLESPNLDINKKIEIANILFNEIFSEQDLTPKRVGGFLKTAVALYKDEKTPKELKDAFYQKITPEILEDLAEKSARERWGMEDTEATLHAYCTFLTIERLWEDDGKEICRDLGKKMEYAREADTVMEKGASEVQLENPNRGTAIYLGVRGGEAQIIALQGFVDACDEKNAQPFVSPYYRSHMETMSLFPKEDPDGNFMIFDEALAELCRIEGSPPGEGLNICVKMNINKKNLMTVFHGVANVGRHILAASGYADGIRLREIQRQGIVYDKPERADAYRKIQLKNTKGAMLICLGDGADPKLMQALKMQVANRNPVINLIENNSVAIGVDINEVVADPELWKGGHGAGVPGIRIEKDDPEGLYLAMRFATTRAILDTGPTIIEVMTSRLLPHSSAHGDHLTATFIDKTQKILTEYSQDLDDKEPEKMAIKKFLENNDLDALARPSKTDHQIALKERLIKFANQFDSNSLLKKKVLAVADEIIDPLEEARKLWTGKGYINGDDIQNWQNKAKAEYEEALSRVLKRNRPKPENAKKHIRLETPEIIIQNPSNKILDLDISGAIRQAILDSRVENSNILIRGTDVYKGLAIVDEKIKTADGKTKFVRKPVQAGGYFRQEEGLFEKLGIYPGALHNTPIDELAVSDYLQGQATTLTDEESLKNSFRILYDPQYVDYGIEAWPSFHVFDSVLYATSGQITRTFGILLLSGASAGGGFMHSGEFAAVAYQTPETDVFYTSNPETTYKLLRYCLLYENNPYIFMVDKTRTPSEKFQEKFEIGIGLWTPGKARTIRKGKDLQFIAYGPMVNTINDAIEQSGKKNIGLLDLVSLRPFPTEDLHNFLKKGSGRIVVAHQEPVSKGFGNQIIERLMTRKEFEDIPKKYMVDRPGPVHIGSEDVPAPPSDKILLDAVIPNVKFMEQIIAKFT